jgi:hypothetical protein
VSLTLEELKVALARAETWPKAMRSSLGSIRGALRLYFSYPAVLWHGLQSAHPLTLVAEEIALLLVHERDLVQGLETSMDVLIAAHSA